VSRGELFGLPEGKGKGKDRKKEAVSVHVHVQSSFETPETESGANPEMSCLDILPAPLYQVLDSYIIAESKSGDVIMIDQHAAAERINFEKLIARYGGG